MENILKLYSYVDGVSDLPFPSKEEQIEITSFKYDAKRMGGAPSLSASFRHRKCMDKLWTYKVYTIVNGERMFLKQIPTSSFDNNDARYNHEAEFVSERVVLDNVFFYDVVDDKFTDRPVSNSSDFSFFGTLDEFVQRLNFSLQYRSLSYSVVVDKGITTEAKQIKFSNMFITQALQEAFKVYEVPYYFKDKVIHFGLTSNTITETFKYGCNNSLLSIKKQNANFKIVNRITGVGSEDNIPYYYPNNYESKEEAERHGETWIREQKNLMPSIYRETLGKERFYNALNDTYRIPNSSSFYEFENEYVEGNPREFIVDFPDIKPSIKGMTNAFGERIDTFIDFAYDRDDNDEKDAEGNYIHPYFFAKLRKFDGADGFNLFDHAIDENEMTFAMTSGSCGSCEFVLGVDETSKKNPVQVDDSGNLIYDEKTGNVKTTGKPLDRQNDTSQYEVWVALRKDNTTFNVLMPNASRNYKPSVGDTFVILHIKMPLAYVKAAEKRLSEKLIENMHLNNSEKFNFSIVLSRIYLQEHPEILKTLNENSRIQLEYDKSFYELYVSSFSYNRNENESLPEISVELTEKLIIAQNAIQTAIDGVKSEILGGNGGDFFMQGLKYFLRKDVGDTSKGLIKFLAGATFGNYVKNEGGVSIDRLGNIILQKLESHGFNKGVLGTGFLLQNDTKNNRSYLEVDELFVRVKALFTELEIKKLSYAGGNWIFSPAGATCFDVKEFDTFYRCYFVADNKEKSVKNEFKTYDQVKCQEFNVKVGTSHNVSNRYYWRLCVGVGDDYIDLSKTDYDTSVPNDIPQKGDAMVTLGNRSNSERQNAIIISAYGEGSPSITQHSGINSYSLKGTEKTRISPEKNKFTGEFIFDSGKSVQNYIDDKTKENKDFIDALDVDIEEIKRQVDKSITTWFYDPVPTLDNPPAIDWDTVDLRNTHLGDLYYSKEGKAYRFQLEGGVYSWVVITDTDITKALADAKKAQDTADHKRRVFVDIPVTPYDEGDLWVNANFQDLTHSYKDDLLRCKNPKGENGYFSIDDWSKATSYTGDENLNKFINGVFKDSVDDLKNQVDGKIDTWYQETNPQNSPSWTSNVGHNGDLWYNTSLKELKRYNEASDSWEIISDKDAIAAAEKASQAKDTADQKRRVFVSTPYAPYEEGDLWVNATMGSYVNELLRCKDNIKKDENGVFSLDDWEKASKYTDDSATEEFKKEVTGHFEATNEKIDGVIESTTTLGDRVTSTENRLTVNESAIELKASQTDVDTLTGRVADNESAITVNSTAISSKVSSIDFNGNNIVSKINQTSTTFDIDASKINLTGAVTFSSFNSTLQTEFSGKADSSSLGNLASQDTVYWSDLSGNTQDTINNKASKSDLEGKANTADLGALAYLSSIGLTDIDADTQGKISGAMQEKTYISGGFIKTKYIDVDNLVATNIAADKGTISCYTIGQEGLVYNAKEHSLDNAYIKLDGSVKSFDVNVNNWTHSPTVYIEGGNGDFNVTDLALQIVGGASISQDIKIGGDIIINNNNGLDAEFDIRSWSSTGKEGVYRLKFVKGILVSKKFLHNS